MRKMLAAVTLAALLPLGSCMTTNLAAWADTRLDSPAEQHMRHGVATLFIFPAIIGDVVTLPIQLLAGFHPYGELCEPLPPSVRYGKQEPVHTGPRGRRER